MDKENGDGGGSSKHKGSNSNNVQPGVDINDPNSLLNAASLFGKFDFFFWVWVWVTHMCYILRQIVLENAMAGFIQKFSIFLCKNLFLPECHFTKTCVTRHFSIN